MSDTQDLLAQMQKSMEAAISRTQAPLLKEVQRLAEVTQQQSGEITALREELSALSSPILDRPIPLKEAWEKLGFTSENACRQQLKRGLYANVRGAIIKRGAAIYLNPAVCLASEAVPAHQRQAG
ncbi:MAG: hypothetical protein AAGJ95_10170 [Cyanobacteria bacterium J06554_11]